MRQLPRGNLVHRRGREVRILGSTIVGAESTPLLTYFLGLLIGQGALLLVTTTWSKALLHRLGSQGQRLSAGIWIGIGMAFAWVALID